jgi:hypothetical protein
MQTSQSWILVAGVLLNACGEKEAPRVIDEGQPPARANATVGVPNPLKTDLAGLTQTDRIDVGNEQDERNHGYVIEGPTFAGNHEFELQSGSYLESGRATKSFEAFRSAVTPWREHTLVKMFDSLAKDQKVRVFVDDKDAGEWLLPNGGPERYEEASFPIPAELIGDRREVTFRIQYLAGSPDTNSFLYWVFAKSASAPAIAQPLKTDLRDLVLTDRVDVGDEESEAAHQYAIDEPVYAGTHDFPWPASNASYRETLRATKTFETFRLKVTPGVNHRLVKAIDTLSKDQKVRVLVEDQVVAAAWSLPNGPERYDEAALLIPARVIGNRQQVTVRVELISSSMDMNSLGYWMYADQGALAQGPR